MTLSNLSDEEVAVLVRTKDQELFHELVERYQKKITGYARYLINDGVAAHDVAQETFIKAFVNLWGFNIRKKFSSWIFRIAHNEAMNYIKKHRRELPLEPERLGDKEIDDSPTVMDNLQKEEIVEEMNQCLNKLPLVYREPLILFFFEEKTYEDISDVLRLPVSTVGTRIRRGKSMLKKIYEELTYK